MAFPDFSISLCAWFVNKPTNRKGIPKPNEYANIRKNAVPGWVTAKLRTAPRTAPTQGVQPTANAAPKMKEVRYMELNFLLT